MEINITFLTSDDIDLMDYSASASELGQDAGRITWENSKSSGHVLLKTEEEKQEARDYIRGFGAWDDEEIQGWNDTELNALILQFIASRLREYLTFKEKGPKEFARYQENFGGEIFESAGQFFFCLNS